MPRTPDRTPGPAIEEELRLEDNGADPAVVGALTLNAGVLKGRDSAGVFDLRSGTGLSESSHRALDQLVHDVAEDSYTEVERTGSRVDAIRIYTDGTKATKIREEEYSYTSGQVTGIVTRQYDGTGTLVETYTETLSYTGAHLDSITGVLA